MKQQLRDLIPAHESKRIAVFEKQTTLFCVGHLLGPGGLFESSFWVIFRAFSSLLLPPLCRVFPPLPYLIYCLSVCFKSLSHMDFSLLNHLPLPHLIPRSLLSSWNWEKSSPAPNTKHQLQAPSLLRFLPCLFSAVSVGNIFTKIIHWIEETDFITIILFVLFKTGKETERKGLCLVTSVT